MQLKLLGWAGLAVAFAMGVYLAITIDLRLLVWIPPSVFIITVYNWELFHGRFHNGSFFSLAWEDCRFWVAIFSSLLPCESLRFYCLLPRSSLAWVSGA